MSYRHLTQHCFEDRIGAPGVSKTRVAELLAALKPSVDKLRSRRNLAAVPLLALPSRTHDVESIVALAAQIRGRFKHVVVVGSGGSGLSGRALCAIKLGVTMPTMHFLETIDPDAIVALLQGRDMGSTCFIVVSKSGATAETISQFYALMDYVKTRLGEQYIVEHFVVITGVADSPLRQAATKFKLCILDHDPDIGGRFSSLTNVGLLPAAIAQMDIKALRRGAGQIIEALEKSATPADFAPALGAALQVAFLEKQRAISVMMPYGERFSGLAAWWRQSCAESLGKAGKGPTPLLAMGTTDQHSQLQLFLDGPKDKWFHLLLMKRAGTGQKIHAPDKPELDYLRGKTVGDVMAAEQRATLETLIKNGCPVRVFECDALTEESFGALMMHLTCEIILTAELLGVNPFDQPAVEDGKRLAREYLLSGNV